MSIPTESQFFSREDPSKPDHAFLKNHFYREGRLSEEQAMFILEKGTEILHSEPNVLSVDAPITGNTPPLDLRAVFADCDFGSMRRYPRTICALIRLVDS
jgi:hypothetical protein